MTKPALIDKDKVLTTQARRIVFDGLMQGFTQAESAKKANLSVGYVRKWVTEGNVLALVRQENEIIQAKTAKKLEITREGQCRKYQSVIDGAAGDKQWSAVNGAIKGQNTLCGLETEQPNSTINIIDALALVGVRVDSQENTNSLANNAIIEADQEDTPPLLSE